jgi:WD40 repeat protein
LSFSHGHLVKYVALFHPFRFSWCYKCTLQHLVTCLVTTIFTGISFFSLLLVSIWFSFEHSIFIRYNGQRLLADVITDLKTNSMEHILPCFARHACAWSRQVSSSVGRAGCGIWHTLIALSCSVPTNLVEERLPFSDPTSTTLVSSRLPIDQSHRLSMALPIPHTAPTTLLPQLSILLGTLEMRETLFAHRHLVRHLQFSPDGKWLATCSYNGTAILFKVSNKVCFVFDQGFMSLSFCINLK